MTMTSASYSPAYGPGTATAKRKGVLRRFVARLIEARLARAEAYIRANSHLVPRELEDRAAWKITERSENSLPFIR